MSQVDRTCIKCGRGQNHYNHEGNVRFRETIADFLPAYKASPKTKKTQLVNDVYKHIMAKGMKFIEIHDDVWVEVTSDVEGRKKVAHRFRDAIEAERRAHRDRKCPKSRSSPKGVQDPIISREAGSMIVAALGSTGGKPIRGNFPQVITLDTRRTRTDPNKTAIAGRDSNSLGRRQDPGTLGSPSSGVHGSCLATHQRDQHPPRERQIQPPVQLSIAALPQPEAAEHSLSDIFEEVNALFLTTSDSDKQSCAEDGRCSGFH